MKKTFRLLAMALMAGAVFAACGDDDNGGDNNNGGGTTGGGDNFPPVTLESKMPSKVVKAGVVDAIEIKGSGFDRDLDYVVIGYKDEVTGEMVYESIPTNAVDMSASRITCGVPIDAPYLDKTGAVYLDRPGYDKFPLSEEITFTLPEIEDGYIPDPGFRKTLAERNPEIAKLFTALGLIDVAGAKKIAHGGSDYPLDLYACPAVTLEGIELFEGITGLVSAWDMPNVKEIDLSNWEAKGIDFRCERAGSLEKFVGAPYAKRIRAYDCPKLTHVDVHMCRWLRSIEVSNAEDLSKSTVQACKFLDLRKEQSGPYKDDCTEPGDHTIYALGGFKVAQDAEIWVDSWFIRDHNVGGHTWSDIYEAWKERNATIKVYQSLDPNTDVLMGTVPTYAQNPEALGPNNKSSERGGSDNLWCVDDPDTKGYDNFDGAGEDGRYTWNPLPGPTFPKVGELTDTKADYNNK